MGSQVGSYLGGAGTSGYFGPSLSAVPTLAKTGFAWGHQPASATVTEGANGITIFGPNQSSAVNAAQMEATAPGTPYTVKMLLSVVGQPNTDASGYVGWGQSGSGGKGIVFDFSPNNPGGFNLRLINNTSYTVTSSVVQSSAANAWPTPFIWVKLVDDGTTAKVMISHTPDDADFYTWYSVTKAGSFLGAGNFNQIVFAASGFSGDARCKLMSWSTSSP